MVPGPLCRSNVLDVLDVHAMLEVSPRELPFEADRLTTDQRSHQDHSVDQHQWSGLS